MMVLIAVVPFFVRRIRVPRAAWCGFALVAAMAISTIVENPIPRAALEVAIQLFLVIGFIVIFNIAADGTELERFDMVRWFVRMGVALALIGIWDLCAPLVGLPIISRSLGFWQGDTVSGGIYVGGLVGTFRNTGQAGEFFQIVLCLAIALERVSGGRRRREMLLSIAICGLALLLTFKRAAAIGCGLGILLLIMREGPSRLVKTFGIIAFAVIVASPSLLELAENSKTFVWRAHRWNLPSEIRNNDFLNQNVTKSFESFFYNPMLGKGAGGTIITSINGVRGGWEIHSTYLKLLGDGGILNVTTYVILMFSLYRCTFGVGAQNRSQKMFARILIPLVIGLMLSWCYTNHLRKREFWISAALVCAVFAPNNPVIRPKCLIR
jgi:hypothetical protein